MMTTPERRLVRSLALYALILMGVHMLVAHLPTSWAFFWYPEKLVGEGGRLAPQEWLWGFYPYTYLARGWQLVLGGLTAVWVLVMGFAPHIPSWHLPYPRSWRWQAILSLAALPLFWLGRTVHTRWGDAYILVKGIAHPDVRLMYNWQAPLDTWLHAWLFRLGEAWWGWTDALPAYWILSSLAGGMAVGVLLRMAGEIGRRDLERWTLFGVMMTLGSVQLFFGYPENYTLISLLMLVFFWLGWRFLQGRGSLWGPGVVLALAHGFHPATLFLQPALWFLVWWGWRRQNGSLPRLVAAVVLPVLLVGMSVLGLMTAGGHGLQAFLGPEAPGGGDHRWWVPFTQPTSQWEYYTMFSRGHVMDVVNEQALTQPFTLFTLALILIFRWKQWPRDGFSWFLLLAAGAYLALIATWNPDYGGQRDWDLFSIAAWPGGLLMAYWLTRALAPSALRRASGIIIVSQLLYTAAWVYSNTLSWEWS